MKKRVLAAVLAISIIFAVPVSAATYRDVPTNHYAYAAVDWVSNPANGAFMVGDSSNNFNPSKTLDKFEAVKILAMAAGYKYSASSITPGEQAYFDKSYDTYKQVLDSYAKTFAKWNSTANREAAFLLARGILQQSELSQFVVKNGGVETVLTLSKQEACMYLVRLAGLQETAEAISLPYHTPYKDDSSIKAVYKPYVYCALEAGIAIGADGYITPERQVTRAEFAQMFYNTLANNDSTDTDDATAVSAVTGVIEDIFNAYPDFYIQASVDNASKLYKFADNPTITINNVQKAATSLTVGMTFNAILNSANAIISLAATATQTGTPTPTPTPTSVPTEITPTPTDSPTFSPTVVSEAEGYITAISNWGLTLKTHRLRLTGETIVEEKDFVLADTCTISRNGIPVSFSNIQLNDIATILYSGDTIYTISLMEKDRNIIGTLLEKKFIEASGTPVLVVQGDDDKTYELRVTSDTFITRRSTYGATWTDLRVGDTVDVQCEYDKAITLHAEGERSTANVVLEEIHITANRQTIVVKKADNTLATYTIARDAYDIFGLRIGMTLRLYLDSWEVYDINILESTETATNIIMGYITALRSGNTIIVADSKSANAKTYSIKIDANTLDTATNKVLKFTDLRNDMYVYIVLTSTNSYIANSITILP